MIKQINHLNLEEKLGLKLMMNQKKGRIIVTLDLERAW